VGAKTDVPASSSPHYDTPHQFPLRCECCPDHRQRHRTVDANPNEHMRATAPGKRGSEPPGFRERGVWTRPDLCPPRLCTSMRCPPPFTRAAAHRMSPNTVTSRRKVVHDASDGELPFVGNSKAPMRSMNGWEIYNLGLRQPCVHHMCLSGMASGHAWNRPARRGNS